MLAHLRLAVQDGDPEPSTPTRSRAEVDPSARSQPATEHAAASLPDTGHRQTLWQRVKSSTWTYLYGSSDYSHAEHAESAAYYAAVSQGRIPSNTQACGSAYAPSAVVDLPADCLHCLYAGGAVTPAQQADPIC